MTNKFYLFLCIVVPLILAPLALSQETRSPLFGDLEPGRYAVGYRTIFTYDESRPSLKAGAKKSVGREMQISVWYPAKRAAGKTRMRFEEYLFLLAQEIEFGSLSSEEKEKGLELFMREPISFGADRAKLAALRSIETAAMMDAPPENKKFPLVIFAHANPASQSIMCEYLASHGFVVGAVPSKGTTTPDYRLSFSNLETIVADMKFVEETVGRLPYVDTKEVGLIGMSNGAMAVVGRHLSNPRVGAIVSLDGSIGDRSTIPALKRFKDYNAAALTAPLMHLFTPNNPYLDHSLIDSYKNADRYLISIPRMRHADFISYGMLEHFVPKIWGDSPGDTKTGFEWLCRYTLHFLKANLNGSDKSRTFLENSPEKNGVPAGLLSVRKKVG